MGRSVLHGPVVAGVALRAVPQADAVSLRHMKRRSPRGALALLMAATALCLCSAPQSSAAVAPSSGSDFPEVVYHGLPPPDLGLLVPTPQFVRASFVDDSGGVDGAAGGAAQDADTAFAHGGPADRGDGWLDGATLSAQAAGGSSVLTPRADRGEAARDDLDFGWVGPRGSHVCMCAPSMTVPTKRARRLRRTSGDGDGDALSPADDASARIEAAQECAGVPLRWAASMLNEHGLDIDMCDRSTCTAVGDGRDGAGRIVHKGDDGWVVPPGHLGLYDGQDHGRFIVAFLLRPSFGSDALADQDGGGGGSDSGGRLRGGHHHVEGAFGSARAAAARSGELYKLRVTPNGVLATAPACVGLQHAATTLMQMSRLADAELRIGHGRYTHGGKRKVGAPTSGSNTHARHGLDAEDDAALRLPLVEVEDWPHIRHRGVMLDISRNRVPTMAELLRTVDVLAELKLNELQLYTEHTFAFTDHEVVWHNTGALTPSDIRELDRHCRKHHIELVPNQQTLAHMHHWLKHDQYRHLAETPYGTHHPFSWRHLPEPFSLAANEQSLTFVEGLLADVLPHFSSNRVNVGLDETFDLCEGVTQEQCDLVADDIEDSAAALGEHLPEDSFGRAKARVYANYASRVVKIARTLNKTSVQMWADVAMHNPDETLPLLRDTGVTLMIWGYQAFHNFAEEAKQIAQHGLPFYVVPGTSSWDSVAGRVGNALPNLANAAAAAVTNGAEGYLIADWGDNGHLQPPPASWPGFVAGAQYAWHVPAARRSVSSASSEALSSLAKWIDVHVARVTPSDLQEEQAEQAERDAARFRARAAAQVAKAKAARAGGGRSDGDLGSGGDRGGGDGGGGSGSDGDDSDGESRSGVAMSVSAADADADFDEDSVPHIDSSHMSAADSFFHGVGEVLISLGEAWRAPMQSWHDDGSLLFKQLVLADDRACFRSEGLTLSGMRAAESFVAGARAPEAMSVAIERMAREDADIVAHDIVWMSRYLSLATKVGRALAKVVAQEMRAKSRGSTRGNVCPMPDRDLGCVCVALIPREEREVLADSITDLIEDFKRVWLDRARPGVGLDDSVARLEYTRCVLLSDEGPARCGWRRFDENEAHRGFGGAEADVRGGGEPAPHDVGEL